MVDHKSEHSSRRFPADRHAPRPVLGRRGFVAAAGAALLLPTRALAGLGEVRSVAFDNLHTGEKLAVEYWSAGRYIPDALQEVNHVLRDFRSGQTHPIAPGLLDLLALVRARLESTAPFSVISGYRSPATNAMLRAEHEHSGVASKSLHMQGMAIDIRVAGIQLSAVRAAGLAIKGGGVGYYPLSDFVHLDVGRIRTW